MSLSSVITRHLQFDAEKQEYTNMPASEAIEFLASYNVRISEVVPGLVLILYDTGCTVFLSPLSDHFCVEIQCDAAINGIGKRSVRFVGRSQYLFSMRKRRTMSLTRVRVASSWAI